MSAGHVRPPAGPRPCCGPDPGQFPLSGLGRHAVQRPGLQQLGGYEAFLAAVPQLTPLGRLAGPDEIGRLAAWILTAAEASYITGQAITADGGDTLRYGIR